MFLVEASETQASLAAAAQLGVIFLSWQDKASAVILSATRKILLRVTAVFRKQPLLPLHPLLHLFQKAFRPQHLYNRSEGENLYQQLRFHISAVIDPAEVLTGVTQFFRPFLITGEMKHGPFQRIALIGYFQDHRFPAEGVF